METPVLLQVTNNTEAVKKLQCSSVISTTSQLRNHFTMNALLLKFFFVAGSKTN